MSIYLGLSSWSGYTPKKVDLCSCPGDSGSRRILTAYGAGADGRGGAGGAPAFSIRCVCDPLAACPPSSPISHVCLTVPNAEPALPMSLGLTRLVACSLSREGQDPASHRLATGPRLRLVPWALRHWAVVSSTDCCWNQLPSQRLGPSPCRLLST